MNEREPLLTGIPASPGIAIGEVVVGLRPSAKREIPRGGVLVSRFTTPLLIPELLRAVALVTDVGGAMSHAAVIARELGIPCVVGTEKATEILKDGMVVCVDGSKGYVYQEE